MTKHRVTLLVVAVALLGLAVVAGCRSAHTTSAVLYIEQEQYQKAIDVIDDGLHYNPFDPEGFFYQGEAYSRMAQQAIDENDYVLAKGSFVSAYGKFIHAREMDPENWTERVAEALDINYVNTKREAAKHWQELNFEEAEGFFRLAFAALPDSLDSIKQIASMKIQQAEIADNDTKADEAEGFRNEALALLDQVLADHPSAYRLRADKAYVLTQLERTDDAQAIYDNLLLEHGDDPQLLLDVVSLYSKQKRYTEAGDLFLKVAGIYFNDTDPANDGQLEGLYSEAGYNFQMANDFPRAIESYGLANEQDVNDETIMLRRVQLHLQYGQSLSFQVAEVMVTDPDEAAELDVLRLATLQRGVDVGNALTDIAPTNADAFYYLAQCQGILGDSIAYEQNMKTYNELTGVE